MEKKTAIATILAAYLFESSDDEDEITKRRRKVWEMDWMLQRQQEGFYTKLLIQLRNDEPELYRNFLRMDSKQFDLLLNLVTPHIKKKDTNMRKSISAGERLVLTLRYLATGENFRSLQYLFRIPKSTISSIIPEVLDAIYKVLVETYLKTPTNPDDWEVIAGKFNEMWQFPNCIGSLDGKHVVIDAPAKSSNMVYNYMGTHSIILMGIADAEYKLLYVNVGRNGGYSDGGVFNHCTFGQALNTNQLGLPPPKPLPSRQRAVPYVLVADGAFNMRQHLLKPYSQRDLSMVQRVFNYRLSRARRIIENVFGIMCSRFGVLRKRICLNPDKTIKVTLACCVLHNFLMTTNKQKYAPANAFDHYDSNGALIPGDWRSEEATGSTMYPLQRPRNNDIIDKDVQTEFTDYFVDEGELNYQYTQID